MSIYEILVRVIGRGGYDKAAVQAKMDVFFMYDRISAEQYDDLMARMTPA